jgi:hypothetical protein
VNSADLSLITISLGHKSGCIEIDPSAIDFVHQIIGCTTDTTFVIRNVGADSLFGNVSESCDYYSLLSGDGPFGLAIGESISVSVRYAPTVAGMFDCAIETAGSLCRKATLSGLADVPCWIATTDINIGSTPVGAPVDTTFYIENRGCDSITCTLTETSEYYEVISHSGSFSIPGGDTAEVTVRFNPVTPGEHNCILDTGCEFCDDIVFTANGRTVCEISPTSIEFGAMPLGTTVDSSFTITNIATEILSGYVEESCDDLEIISGGGPFTLGQDQTQVVELRFQPSSPGVNSCTVETGNGVCQDVNCYAYVCSSGYWGQWNFDDCKQGWTKSIPFDGLLWHVARDTGSCLKAIDTVTNGSGLNVVAPCGAPGDLSGFDGIQWDYYVFPCPYYQILRRPMPVLFGPDSTIYVPSDNTAYTIGEWDTDYVPFEAASWQLSGQSQGSMPFNELIRNVARLQFAMECNNGGLNCKSESMIDNIFLDGALPPVCVVAPTSIGFGLVVPGEWQDTTFIITNAGGDTLSGAVSDTCSNFSIVSGGGPFSLLGGDTLEVTVRFEPAVDGVFACTIETGDTLCSDVTLSGRACSYSTPQSDYEDMTLQGWTEVEPFTGTLANVSGNGGRCMTPGQGSGGLYACAPCSYTGDISSYWGIQWDEYLFPPPDGCVMVRRTHPVLIAADGTAFRPADTSPLPTGEWHPCAVPFYSSLWIETGSSTGLSTFSEVLRDVAEIRMRLDCNNCTMSESKVDNITLAFAPTYDVPTLSKWSLISLILILIGAAGLLIRLRRPHTT